VIVLGIDPGKTGGLAFLTLGIGPVPILHLEAMPVVTAKAGKGRTEYDVPEIVRLVSAAQHRERGNVVVFLERLHPMPLAKGGTIANYNRGAASHLFIGILAALGIAYHLVLPVVWQRMMLEGTSGADTKQRSVIAAQRIFPGVSFLPTERSRKPSDGLTDAALLAEFGRRKLAGERGQQRGLLEAS
jgi:hypothetical protein